MASCYSVVRTPFRVHRTFHTCLAPFCIMKQLSCRGHCCMTVWLTSTETCWFAVIAVKSGVVWCRIYLSWQSKLDRCCETRWYYRGSWAPIMWVTAFFYPFSLQLIVVAAIDIGRQKSVVWREKMVILSFVCHWLNVYIELLKLCMYVHACVLISKQGGHKPWKLGILRDFSEHGKLVEFSGNSVQPQRKIETKYF